jgi:hypothetical protein
MIQRIQTLYLIIALVILSFIIISPFGYFISADHGIYQLSHGGLAKITGNIYTIVYVSYSVTILVAIAISFVLYAIIKFKKRGVQLLFCKWLIFLSIVLNIVLFWLYFKTAQNFETSKISWSIFMPVVSILPVYMAMRAIRKDEELVKSADRLR